MLWFPDPSRKDEPLGLRGAKPLGVPPGVIQQRREQLPVQRNGAAFASVGLALADGQVLLFKINLAPGEIADF